jgi:hypothetical protein
MSTGWTGADGGGVMATRSRKLTCGARALIKYFEQRKLRGLEEYYAQHERDRDRDRAPERDDDVVYSEVWGSFARRLGVDQLTRAQFTDLVNGEWEGHRLVGAGYRKVTDPKTGEVRTETGVRTTMIDVVYAAPKSVMAYVVHRKDPELTRSVIDAFRESVREAFEDMQEHAKVARVPVRTPTEAGRRTVQHGERAGEESRMQGSATTRVPAELIALPIVQLAARPTKESIERGYVADPHLHMHVPVIAVCAVPDAEHPDTYRTYTPDDLGIKREAAERDAVLMGEFARRLEDLGIELEYHTDQKGRVSWEVAGIPREVSLHFSTNHLRAERLRAEFQDRRGRPPTDAELAELLRQTRLPKDEAAKDVDERGAWQAWRDELRSTGIEITAREPHAQDRARSWLPERVRAMGGRSGVGRRPERPSVAERRDTLRQRLLGPTGLHREDAVVDRETVRVSIARAAVGLGFTRPELDEFEHRFVNELIPVRTAHDPQFDLFALPHLIEAEVWVGSDIEARAAAKPAAPTWAAKHHAMAKATVRLSREQREAISAMCEPTGWANLVGRAGTGKTTVLRTVTEALGDPGWHERTAGDKVIVVSRTKSAAERSRAAIRADRAYSVEGFLTAVDHGLRVTDRTWVLVDEGALANTPHNAALLHAVGPAVLRSIRPAADQVIVVSTGATVAEQSGRAIGADRAYSIDAFSFAVKAGMAVTERTWIFLDEAAMVDTPHMKMLLEAAGPAVIRAIGDDRQLPAIGPGGWYAEQLDRNPGPELTYVYRQRNRDDVRDFTALGAGRVEEAVRSLDARHRITVVDERGQRAHAIVDLYRQERMRGRSAGDVVVAVDGSNHVLDDLNRRIQRERLVMEEIGGMPLQVEATDDDRRWQLYRGDHIVFRQRVKAENSQIVRNGVYGEIVRINHERRRITVQLDRGGRVEVTLREVARTQPVVPAYVRHVAAFQGGELPAVIVSPSRLSVRNSAYAGLTRTVEDVYVVIDRESYGDDPIEGLIRDWSRTSDKRTAWSQVGDVGREQWARWKAGDDAGGREPPDASRAMHDDRAPVGVPPDPAPAPAAATAPRPTERDEVYDIDHRDADADAEIEPARHAATENREATHVVDLEDVEVSESLAHDVDAPRASAFGDIDAIIDRRRQALAARRNGQIGPVPQPEAVERNDLDRWDRDWDAKVDALQRDAAVTRETAWDHKAAVAVSAEEVEASAPLLNDVELPQVPAFGDIGRQVEGDWQATGWPDDLLEPAPDEDVSLDVDVLRWKRAFAPEPEREPPDLDLGR